MKKEKKQFLIQILFYEIYDKCYYEEVMYKKKKKEMLFVLQEKEKYLEKRS